MERHAVGGLTVVGRSPAVEADEVAHPWRAGDISLFAPRQGVKRPLFEVKVCDGSTVDVDYGAGGVSFEDDDGAAVDEHFRPGWWWHR